MNKSTKQKQFSEWALMVLLLVPCVLLAYMPVWHGGFIWDDDTHLTQNPCIVGPLGFKGIWTTSAATYYPLVLTTLWIQHAIWGLNPAPYHILNIAMHAAAALALWRVLVALRVKGAWLGAALWALHPVQVESVAWVSELKNTQSCLLYLLAIQAFLKSRDTTSRRRSLYYWLALGFAALAILSKSSTVMLPVVLGLCLWWRENSFRARDVMILAPFLAISAVASGWTIWEEKFIAKAVGTEWNQSWLERLVIAGKAVWFYLAKLFWPHPLVLIYPRWQTDSLHFTDYLPVVALVGLACGIVLLWRLRTGWARPPLFAFAYFTISLFPVLGFFNVHYFLYSYVADHFQYLASIGPLALVGAGVMTVLSRWKDEDGIVHAVACGGMLLILAVLTWTQSATYATPVTLYKSTIEKNPACWMAHNNLGALYSEKGDVTAAAMNLQKALELKPDYAEAHNNFGNFLLQMGRVDESIAHFERAQDIQAGFPGVENNLGNAYFQKGAIDAAIQHYERALDAKGDDVFAHSGLGAALAEKGDFAEAQQHFQKALEARPSYVEGHYNLAKLFLQTGRSREAAIHLEKALQLQPGLTAAQSSLAWLLATSSDSSVRDGRRALDLGEHASRSAGGTDPTLLRIVAAAEAECGDFSQALAVSGQAMAIAKAQRNDVMVAALDDEQKLYKDGKPLRDAIPGK